MKIYSYLTKFSLDFRPIIATSLKIDIKFKPLYILCNTLVLGLAGPEKSTRLTTLLCTCIQYKFTLSSLSLNIN